MKEEKAIILDYLKRGYPDDTRPFHQREPIAQALGKDHFTLLELVPRSGVQLAPYDEVYIGEGKREKIKYIKRSISFTDLTQTAKTELPFVVEKLVEAHEKKFVDFYNYSDSISVRAHQLELLPSVGKKHASKILEERQVEPFENFENVKERVPFMPDPKKAIVDRIMSEIKGEDRHRLFVRV